MQRRNFIYQSLCIGGMVTISKSLVFASSSNDAIYSPFVLPPLPFAVNALEPHIDKQTMEIHHGKHHASYVKNLNKELEGNTELQGKSIEKICETISKFNLAVRNNAGGHYNHSLFWKLLGTNGGKASTKLNEAIIKDFGSMEAMQTQFNEAAKTRFGSGWAWLIYSNGKLKICSTPNQDNPLMDIADSKGYPLITVDVWEHAYYLKYQNRRPDYISAFWNVLNWKEVSERFEIANK